MGKLAKQDDCSLAAAGRGRRRRKPSVCVLAPARMSCLLRRPLKLIIDDETRCREVLESPSCLQLRRRAIERLTGRKATTTTTTTEAANKRILRVDPSCRPSTRLAQSSSVGKHINLPRARCQLAHPYAHGCFDWLGFASARKTSCPPKGFSFDKFFHTQKPSCPI